MRARENVMPPPSVNINFVISELQKSKNCKGITAIEIIMDRGKRDSKHGSMNFMNQKNG